MKKITSCLFFAGVFLVGLIIALHPITVQAANVTFVQAKAVASPGAVSSFPVSFTSNTVAGNLILVGFDFAGATVNSVTDSQGNTFVQIGNELVTPGSVHNRLYYAKNITGGADTITVTFSGSSQYTEMYAVEYAGADTTNPIDVQVAATGSSSSVSSTNATTTVANDKIIGFCIADWACTFGSGFTARLTLNNNLMEDKDAGAPGSYAATGSATNGWSMQMVALRPAPSAPDTIPPTVSISAPSNGALVGGSSVTVSANASDNVGVLGVQFLLDGANLGAEDASSPYSITWNSTSASAGSHTLSAVARDAASNTTTATNVTVTVDNTAPTGSILINSGAAATNSTASVLTLSATDTQSSVTQMRFSNTGSSFSAAETYATTKNWTLTTGAGTKTVYVQFKDAVGNWSGSFTDTIVLDTTAPTISSVASSSITSSGATITWTTNEPATSQVEYGVTTSYGTLTSIDNTLVTSHTVVLSGLSASTNYSYRVRSKDAATNERIGLNNTFTTTAFTDTVPPSVPTNLAGTPVSMTQIDLSWTASTDNVGVTGYKIFRNGNQVGTSATANYSDTGLTLNTTYNYTVSAYDAAGNNSPQSDSINVTTLNDIIAPSVPTGLSATAVSSSQINLSWTASTDNVSVTGYKIFRDGNQITTTSATTYSDTGLTISTTYSYTVSAYDNAGNESSQSTSASATTFTPDTTVPIVSITAPVEGTTVSGTSVTVSANASDNVGVAGVQFKLDGNNLGTEDTVSPYAVVWNTTTATNASHVLTAIARDAAGNTTTSTSVNVTINNTIPPTLKLGYCFEEGSGTAVADQSTAGNNGTIQGATWTTLGMHGNGLSFNGTSGYVNSGASSSLRPSLPITISMWIKPTSFSSQRRVLFQSGTNLSNHTGYLLELNASGALKLGYGDNSSGCSSSGRRTKESATPVSLNVWQHVTGIIRSATDMSLYINGIDVGGNYTGSGGAMIYASTFASVGQQSDCVTSPTYFAGSMDDLRVYAKALTPVEVTADMNTSVCSGAPDTTPPSTPTNLSATAVSASQINLSWTASTDNVAVTGYKIFRDGNQIATSTTTTYSNTGLTASTTYIYTVSAYDAASNNSSQSSSASATTFTPDTTPPSVPTNLIASNITWNSLLLSWTASTDNVGVTGYKIFKDGNQVGTSTTTSFSNTGLAASTTYSYTVSAYDAASNNSVQSNAINATTSDMPPTPPFPVAVSFDHKYLIDQYGQPFFITGDTAWSMLVQLTNEETDTYLSDRAAKGYNTIIVTLVEHMFAANPPADVYGNQPFTTPGDFNTPNEAYFARVDYIVQKAANYGITLMLFPSYAGYQCSSEGWCQEMQASSDATMTAWGQYVGSRYKNYPNIIWAIGADMDPALYNIKGKLNDVALGIKSMDVNHLMTAHNVRGQSALDVWSGYSWLDISNIYNQPQDIPAKANSEYQRSDFLPFFLIEDWYENEHSMTPLALRTESYWSVLSGATLGRFSGNCPIWGFATYGFCANVTWQSQLSSPGSVAQSWLGKLFRSRENWKLVPDINHSVVTAGYQSGATLATTARTSDGQSIISYIPTQRVITVDMSKISDSSAKAWWFNPQTGASSLIGTFSTVGLQTFNQVDSNDWVLVIDGLSANLPAPGI